MQNEYENTLGSERTVEKVDIVIQGGIWGNHTYETAVQYSELSFVNQVIVSTWKGEEKNIDTTDDRLQFVFSEPPTEDGGGNINYQIISSREGIKLCTSLFCVKMRSDQQIPNSEMERMHSFYNDHKVDKEIFVLGMGTHFPYHPQDHVFWGETSELTKLFDIPLSNWESYKTNVNFNTNMRAPIYIGALYYARYSQVAEKHANNFHEYLLDSSPKREEAFEEYFRIKDKYFKSFPRIKMNWHKYRQGYPYAFYYDQGERYHDE